MRAFQAGQQKTSISCSAEKILLAKLCLSRRQVFWKTPEIAALMCDISKVADYLRLLSWICFDLWSSLFFPESQMPHLTWMHPCKLPLLDPTEAATAMRSS